MHIEPSIVCPTVTWFLSLEYEICCLTFGLPHYGLFGFSNIWFLLLLCLDAVELIHAHLVLFGL